MALRLLLVEDNEHLNGMIAAHFRERHAAVDVARNGADALTQLSAATHDAMILDLGLPDMDGLAVLRQARAGGFAPPTLILTARDWVDQRIAGLDAGADDYVLKPFDIAELEARLRAVLRRPGLRWSERQLFGDLRFDAALRILTCGEHQAELSPRETSLLDALLASAGRVVVRDALADRLFEPGAAVSANALEAIVSRVRRKLAEMGSATRIETLRGLGYRLGRIDDGGPGALADDPP